MLLMTTIVTYLWKSKGIAWPQHTPVGHSIKHWHAESVYQI